MLHKPSIFSLLALLFALQVNGQLRTLRGKVVDATTREPLPFASVFINFTTIGTNADDQGVFELKNIPQGDPEIICSHVGHENYQVKLSRIGNSDFLEIKLKPVVMKEVEVTSKKDEKWNNQLRKFEDIFLGAGKGAKADILNPWVLDFKESSDGVFTATASSPLEIQNHFLGYRVIYVLKSFIHTGDAYNIAGDVRFEKIATADQALANRWQSNRKKVFEGSSRHLFRAMIKNTSEQEGFKLYEDKTAPAPIVRSPYFKNDLNSKLHNFEPENKVIKDKAAPVYRIIAPQRLEVHYRKRAGTQPVYRDLSHAVSWIEVAGGIIEVNPQGIVLNPGKLVVSGTMGDARIAQLLPYDFELNDHIIEESVVRKPEVPMADLIEKPYVHTDKPYYYPQEVIWFKGYMSYADRDKADSLSKVVYVDLFSKSKLIEHNAYQVENGMFKGSIAIPAHTQPDEYFLRAYTNWTRNFKDDYFFVKPLYVLSTSQSVAPHQSVTPVSKGIVITANKESYSPRERIQLKFTVTDSAGNPAYADVSVSVTDLQQVTPLAAEKTVIDSYKWRSPPSTAALQYKIEYGLSFTGQFRNSKGKPERGEITIVEGNFDNVLNLTSLDDGKFFLDNIHFNDTVRIAVQGKGQNKKAGVVDIDPPGVPDLLEGESLSIDVVASSGTQRYRANVEDTAAQLLPEITVKSNRTEDRKNVNPFKEKRYVSKHGTPDITVDGDWLRKYNSTNLLYALQSRVAGLRVIAYMDGNGAIQYTLKFGGPSNLMSAETTAPLVLINDVPLALDVPLVTQYLANLSVSEVERVEVLRYGKGAAYGTRGGNGVIAVYLRASLDDAPLGPRSRTFDTKTFQTFTLEGYAPARDFPVREYSVNDDNEADYRATVYWDPSVTTDNQGVALVSFYAADLPTSYRVVVEGVSSGGEPVRGEAIVRIVE